MLAARIYFITFLAIAFLGSWTTSADPGSALDMPPPIIAGISSVVFILMVIALFNQSLNANLLKDYQQKIISLAYFTVSFYSWVVPIYQYWDQAAFSIWGWGFIILIFIDLGASLTILKGNKKRH